MSKEQYVAMYERERSNHVRFTQKLESLLRDLLAVNSIGYHLLECRTKDVQSVQEKLSRGSKAYADSFNEMTDLSGLRVITYYQDEAAAVGKLIETEFSIDRTHSVIHKPDLAEFGYLSSHYVVRLSPKRADLMEWSGLGSLKAEIQIRTVLQHAWAAISHKLQYKRETDVPTTLRRKLFRLSALFELADDEFIALRDASGNLTQSIRAKLAEGNQNLPIDFLSLTKFVETSEAVKALCAIAAEVGFNFESPAGQEEDRDDSSAVSDLVQLAGHAALTTLQQLEVVLSDALIWADPYLRKQYNGSDSDERSDWYVTPGFVCQLVLLGAKTEDLRPSYLYRLGWNRKIANRVFEVAKQFRKMV